MLFAQMILLATGAILVIIGIGFLWAPDGWARYIDVIAPTPTARTDIRATYGGFVLAVGLFLVLCALRADWTLSGLFACGLVYTGFAGGRLMGIVLEKQASRLMAFFLVVEIVGATLSFAAFLQLSAS